MNWSQLSTGEYEPNILVDALLENGSISLNDVQEARRESTLKQKSLMDILTEEKSITDDLIDEALEQHLRLPPAPQLSLLSNGGKKGFLRRMFAKKNKRKIIENIRSQAQKHQSWHSRKETGRKKRTVKSFHKKEKKNALLRQWHQRQSKRVGEWRREQNTMQQLNEAKRKECKDAKQRKQAEIAQKRKEEEERIKQKAAEVAERKRKQKEEQHKKKEEERQRKEDLKLEKARLKREKLRARIRQKEEAAKKREEEKRAREEAKRKKAEQEEKQKEENTKKYLVEQKMKKEEAERKKEEIRQKKIFSRKMREEEKRKILEEKRRRKQEDRDARRRERMQNKTGSVQLITQVSQPKTEEQLLSEAHEEAQRQFLIEQERKKIAKLSGEEPKKQEPHEVIITAPVSIRTLPPEQTPIEFIDTTETDEGMEMKEISEKDVTEQDRKKTKIVKVKREVVIQKMSEEERAQWEKQLNEQAKKIAEMEISLERERSQNNALHREMSKQISTASPDATQIGEAVHRARTEEQDKWKEERNELMKKQESGESTTATGPDTDEIIRKAKEEERTYWEREMEQVKKQNPQTSETTTSSADIEEAVRKARDEERSHWQKERDRLKKESPTDTGSTDRAGSDEAIRKAKEEERSYWETKVKKLEDALENSSSQATGETRVPSSAEMEIAIRKAKEDEQHYWEKEMERVRDEARRSEEKDAPTVNADEAVRKAKEEERRYWERELERVRDEARRSGGGISNADVEEAVRRGREEERRFFEREKQDLEDQRRTMERAKEEATSSGGDAMTIAQKIVMEEKERMEKRMQEERDQWAEERRRMQSSALKGTAQAMEKKTGIEQAQEDALKKEISSQRASLDHAQMELEEERKLFEKEKEMMRTASKDLSADGEEEEEEEKEEKKTQQKKTTKKSAKEEKRKKGKSYKKEEDEDVNIGEILFKQNYISEEEYKRAKESSEKRNIPIDIILKEEGLITKELTQNAIAEFYKIPFYDLRSKPPDPATVEILPEDTAVSLGAVVINKEEDGTLTIATNHPERSSIKEDLKEALPEAPKILLVYASKEAIESALTFYRKPLDTRFRRIIERQKKVAPEIIEEIFIDAIQLGASDIHFEPQEKIIIVRFRVDGVMHEAGKIPKEYFEGIVNRIKIAGNMRIDEHYAAQDGAIRWKHGKQYMDVRVSIVPIVDGEKIVMRLLSDYIRTLTLGDLGFTPSQQDILLKAVYKPFGMILTTGPTGSGKSTTLYGCLKIRNTPDINISTIEDPVEYKIPGINHIQVNEKSGLTFEKGLRAIVRQDPDVVLVGEIRDTVTAQISVNAALTGHLLFSTLHANDAATALPRLTEMDIEPYLLASTLEIIIAQRLIRKVCPHCRYSERITEKEACKLFPHAERYFADGGDVTLYKGGGCKSCGNTGYKGRLGIYELLQITPELEELIVGSATSTEVNNVARAQGMQVLFEDGLQKALSGHTTVEELLRIAEPPDTDKMPLDKAIQFFRSNHV